MRKKLVDNNYNQELLNSLENVYETDFIKVKKSDQPETIENVEESKNIWSLAWNRFKKNKMAVVSLIVIVLFILIAIFAPQLATNHPNEQNPTHANLPPKIHALDQFSLFDGNTTNREGVEYNAYEEAGVPSEVEYIFGTDALGRDLFARILQGTRISLIVAFASVVINVVLGVIYGLISGWFGGKVDVVMQRILEIISGIPSLVIVILLILVMDPGITAVVTAIALTSWMNTARVVRAQTLGLKNREYITASRLLGQSTFKILFRHLLPNMMGTLIVQVMTAIPFAIFYEAFLSFIGVGIPAPNASLGSLINEGYLVFRFYPHLMWYPGIFISLIMLSFNLFADGIREALDPKSEE